MSVRWTHAGAPVGPPAARGWLSGEVVYETLLVRAGLPSTWALHLERLEDGARRCGLPWPGRATLEAAVRDAIEDARHHRPVAAEDGGFTRLRVDLVATGGSLLEPPSGCGIWVRTCAATTRVRPPARVTLGPRLRNPHDPLAGVKRAAFPADLAALRAARGAGFDEVLLRDVTGRISEASTSALVVGLADGRLVTPHRESAPLPSTTLALLRRDGAPIEDAPVTVEDLATARFAVLLNAVQGARPVATIDGAALPAPPDALLARARALVDDA